MTPPASIQPPAARDATIRHRWKPNPAQRALLKAMFDVCDTPNRATVDALSRTLGVRPRQARIWFQNRRQRARKQDETTPSSPLAHSGLAERALSEPSLHAMLAAALPLEQLKPRSEDVPASAKIMTPTDPIMRASSLPALRKELSQASAMPWLPATAPAHTFPTPCVPAVPATTTPFLVLLEREMQRAMAAQLVHGASAFPLQPAAMSGLGAWLSHLTPMPQAAGGMGDVGCDPFPHAASMR